MCVLTAVLLYGCEKPVVSGFGDDEETEAVVDGVRVTFDATQYVQEAFGAGVMELSNASQGSPRRAMRNVKEVCSRLTFAVFHSGEKMKVMHQLASDDDFGRIVLVLPEGTYQVVAVAHSGNGSATVSSPTEISFPNNKVTDTFLACEDVTVAEDSKSFSLQLERCVAMFRLVVADEIPEEVVQMKFYYTGGSSTLDAVSGVGCKKSRQTEFRDVTSEMHSTGQTFEVFSFPRVDSDALEMQVTAFDASGNIVKEREFASVSIRKNYITAYEGSFFAGISGEDPGEFGLFVNDEWADVMRSQF
ncbi:MAG: FimB/Mfa2 family fimbrial subunit [Prevotella sp.]|nr:FimB/Mfa2 family fimbrial subunit [Prevotella sp.]